MGSGRARRDAAGVRALTAFAGLFTIALPAFRFDSEPRIEQDDLVMIHGHAEGTRQGPPLGTPPTGRPGRSRPDRPL